MYYVPSDFNTYIANPKRRRDLGLLLIWIECLAVFAVAIAVTIATTPLARKLAIALGAIDYPDKRRVNKAPVPRMGGIAMFAGMIAACVAMIIGHYAFGWLNPFGFPFSIRVNFILVAVGITFMFLVGLIDDVIDLRARYKLIGQIIAASFIAASGLLLQNIQNPFIEGNFIQFGILSYPITVLYLVCFANVINLIDGLDGLASGISAISAMTLFAFAMLAARFDSALLCIIIVGVCVGFLKYNYHPASIFMGDSGSLLLGLSLGVVSLMAVARSTLIISLLVPLLATGIPILDTGAAIIRRKRAHQPIDSPDKGHIHHRILSAGYTQQSTVLIIWAWTAMLAICGIVLAESEGIFRIVVIVIVALVTGIAIYKLHLLNPVLQHYYNPRKHRRKKGASKKSSSHTQPKNNAIKNGAPSNGSSKNRVAKDAPTKHISEDGYARKSADDKTEKAKNGRKHSGVSKQTSRPLLKRTGVTNGNAPRKSRRH